MSLLVLLNVVYLFVLLDQSRRNLENSVREDVMWAVYQTDRQARDLKGIIDEGLLGGAPIGRDAILKSYDILYSRAELLSPDDFVQRFGKPSELAEVAGQSQDSIYGLASTVDALGEVVGPDSLRSLRGQLMLTMDLTSDLVLRTNNVRNILLVEQRLEVEHLQGVLSINVGLLVLGFVGIVTLMAVQMRFTAAVGRKLALLGERHRRVARRAQAASRAKSTFLATMSHEIRTPLNGIIGASEILGHLDLPADGAETLSMIRESGYHLLEVITDILDFSKLESRHEEFERHAVVLPEVADTLLAILRPRAELKNLTLEINFPAIEITSDPARLRQVLVNLIGNAIKFTSRGSVAATGVLLASGRLRVEVRDTGVGISKDALPLLFRDFSQVDGSASRSYGGTGLGLAICKRIVQGLGGSIGVSSTSGSGSTFRIEIPAGPVSPWTGRDQTRPPVVEEEGRFRGRVLVVEDNAVNRKVAKGLLEWLGVTVELACDGEEALERLSSETFDLVFMDLQMPRLNGLDTTRAIRAKALDVRVVGLTGNAFVSDRRDCLAAGMNDFLAKPVTRAKLVQVLTEAGLSVNAKTPLPTSDEGSTEGRRDLRAPISLFDRDLFEAIVTAIGRDIAMDLVGEVITEADTLACEWSGLMAAQKVEEAASRLHAFKGAAINLGFTAAAHRAEALRADPFRDPDGFDAVLADLAGGLRDAGVTTGLRERPLAAA